MAELSLVERLRDVALRLPTNSMEQLLSDAADEIERLSKPAERVGVPTMQRVVDADGVPCSAFGNWVAIGSHETPAGKFILREGFRFEYGYVTPIQAALKAQG